MSQEHPHQYVVPDAIEPVVGWKSWLISNDGLLSSPSFPLHWQAGMEARASCAHEGDPKFFIPPHVTAPHEACKCGIYIAQDAAIASRYGYILGSVYGWGKVIKHAVGWRAEFAYPKMFYVDNEFEAPALRKYNVPIMTMSSKELWEFTRENTGSSELFDIFHYESLEMGYRIRRMRRDLIIGAHL